jgi:hypothetical protein
MIRLLVDCLYVTGDFHPQLGDEIGRDTSSTRLSLGMKRAAPSGHFPCIPMPSIASQPTRFSNIKHLKRIVNKPFIMDNK